MKDFTKRYSLLVLIFSFASMACNFSLPVLASNDAKNQDKRLIRVTTGIQQVQGWEQGLIKANPNLARWHWDPIYSYKQGIGALRPEQLKGNIGPTGNKARANQNLPAYNYNIPAPQDNRPKHIPFSSKALAEVQAKYSQPVQPRFEGNVQGRLTSKQTQARLITPTATTSSTMSTPSTTIATYGHLYNTQEKLDTKLKYSSDKTAVYGQLVKKQKTYSNKNITTKRINKN